MAVDRKPDAFGPMAKDEVATLDLFRMIPRPNQIQNTGSKESSTRKTFQPAQREISRLQKNSAPPSSDLKYSTSKAARSSYPPLNMKSDLKDSTNQATAFHPETKSSILGKNNLDSSWNSLHSDSQFFDMDYFSLNGAQNKPSSASLNTHNTSSGRQEIENSIISYNPHFLSAQSFEQGLPSKHLHGNMSTDDQKTSRTTSANASVLEPGSMLDDDDTPMSLHTFKQSDDDHAYSLPSSKQPDSEDYVARTPSSVKREELGGAALSLDLMRFSEKTPFSSISVTANGRKGPNKSVSAATRSRSASKSDSFDPIMSALSSLQQEKKKLEYELNSTLSDLSATQNELANTKSTLSFLKEKTEKLSATIKDIGSDREELRRTMDSCTSKIEFAHLGILELKGDVGLAHRKLSERNDVDEDTLIQLRELDRELNNSTGGFLVWQLI